MFFCFFLAIRNVILLFLAWFSLVENSAASLTVAILKVTLFYPCHFFRISFLSLIFCSVTMMCLDVAFFMFFFFWIEFFLIEILWVDVFLSVLENIQPLSPQIFFSVSFSLFSVWDSTYIGLWDIPVCLFHLSSVFHFTNQISSIWFKPI